ncbi:MAG: hypothetical protein AMDU1_APLC00041G0003 [Thermoplasmatales archaeon A-plasma]|nr:MAG: hypothetical protein AMDU1_APLC00041G0003 [Thermoplasmatales archaeon A-plasma]
MTLVDLIPLKTKALNFPEPVKSLILSEPDTIDAQDFISKLGTYEMLFTLSATMGVSP